MDFKNRTAVITGASRGIGRAIAIKLSELGANIVINYSGSMESAKTLSDELELKGIKVLAIKTDVSNIKQVEEMFETIYNNFGCIDFLINNAGITKDALMLRMTNEDFDRVIDVNLKGTFNCTKTASKYMIKQRQGKIINISSVVGVIGNIGQVNYASSKAGIIGLTKSAARELAGRGINVNAIAPGFIQTEMTDKINQKIKDDYINKIPLKKFGKPEDIANCVAFLCSEEANYITGQVINIDGGMVM